MRGILINSSSAVLDMLKKKACRISPPKQCSHIRIMALVGVAMTFL